MPETAAFELSTPVHQSEGTPVLTPDDAAALLARMDEPEEQEQEATEQPKAPPQKAKEPPKQEEAIDEAEEQERPAEEPSEDENEAVEAKPEDEAEQEEEPEPLSPPASLTKAEKETFRALPREVQESWIERENAVSRVRKEFESEHKERLRLVETQSQELVQMKQQYEQALPKVLGMLQTELAAKFPNVRTHQDADRLLAQDPKKYLEWHSLVEKTRAVEADHQRALADQQRETAQRFKSYVDEQQAKFLEKAPEWADDAKAAKLQSRSIEVLEEIGFTKPELSEMWNQGKPLSAHDHRFQLLVAKAVRFDEAQKRAAKAKTAPKAPTRPGVSDGKNAGSEEQEKAQQQRFARTGSAEDAAALIAARL